MISITAFSTSSIKYPINKEDMLKQYSYGDKDIYNPKIGARFHIEDDTWNGLNVYSCNICLKDGFYRNFSLIPVTRNKFYILALFPQLSSLNEFKDNKIASKIIPKLPFISKILNKYNNADGFQPRDDYYFHENILAIGVNANVRQLVFAKDNNIINTEIRSAYKQLCFYADLIAYESNLFVEFYEKACDELEKKIEREREQKIEFIKTKVKRFVIRKGAKTLISLALAGATCGLSVIIDAADSISDISDFMDVTDLMDMFDIVDIGEVVDFTDMTTMLPDFDLLDVSDIDLDYSDDVFYDCDDLSVDETSNNMFSDNYYDDLSSDSSNNVSFGRSKSEIKNDIAKQEKIIGEQKQNIEHWNQMAKSKIKCGQSASSEQSSIKTAIRKINEAKDKIKILKYEKPT